MAIKPDTEDPDPTETKGWRKISPLGLLLQNKWAAKVLEIRALNNRHVFLRVQYLYRPEDLDPPLGREPHHGALELIPSNYMQIVEARKYHLRILCDLAPSLSSLLMYSSHSHGRWALARQTLGRV